MEVNFTGANYSVPIILQEFAGIRDFIFQRPVWFGPILFP